jgi:hypothetical protein
MNINEMANQYLKEGNRSMTVQIKWEDLTEEKQREIEQEFIQKRLGDIDEIDYEGENGYLGEIEIFSI